MTTALSTTRQNGAIVAAGQVANTYAAADAFADYTERREKNTIDAERADLATFAEYLCTVVDTLGREAQSVPEDKRTEVHRAMIAYAAEYACPDGEALQTDPATWHGVTWGLVSGFVRWMLQQGSAISTVNRKLSTVKVYAKLATQAGAIDAQDGALIRTVTGYGRKEGKKVDDKRAEAGTATRTSHKKAGAVSITPEQAAALKAQPDTPQGRRDAVIMCLLLDHGLRVGELALLQVTDFDLKAGTFSFYRPKVDKTQTHRMTPDTKAAIARWIGKDAPVFPDDADRRPLLRASRKGGALTEPGMIDRAITERVRVLGKAKNVGLLGLSAHDCRHYWATYWGRKAAKGKISLFQLQEAGGWSSLAMPRHYVEDAKIANEGMQPDE